MARSTTALLALVTALLFGACADDYGESCSLPDSAQVQTFCEAAENDDDGARSATCVFTNSPSCDSRICARYIGSEDFCTIECDPEQAGDCPGDSFCQVVPSRGLAFCVPQEILESIE